MSLYNELINGKGHKSFYWEVLIYIGDDETKTIADFNTYLEALIFKLQHKDCEKLDIDLWYFERNELFHQDPKLVGTNFLKIKEFCEKYTCTSQNIVLSL